VRALSSQSIRTAPGPEKFSFASLGLLWKWDKERIVELPKAAVGTGRHPAVWKWACWVAIRRPGKHNYTEIFTCRSISLLSSIAKVVGKVVAELPVEEAERRELLSNGEYGSRKP